ncbi:hypothetical protein WN943_018354 [Citrus x changshan-huyou]
MFMYINIIHHRMIKYLKNVRNRCGVIDHEFWVCLITVQQNIYANKSMWSTLGGWEGHEHNYFSLSTDLYSKETITMAALNDQDYCQWIHRRE